MNNPVTIIDNDPSPLGPSPNALDALDEQRNIKEWIENEFTSHATKSSITQSDVAHSVQVLMGNKLVAKMHNRMVENTFGLIFHHAMTEEPIGEDFYLLYLYKVDLTDASAESYLAHAGPNVKIMDVERKISPPAPHCVSIRVNKSLYQKFSLALKTLAGSWLKKQRERMALGLPPKVDTDDPNLLVSRVEYENFMSQMDIHLSAAANSLIRGDNTNSLFRIIRQSPSVYSLTKTKRFRNVMDRSELVRRMISFVPQLTFGLNKIVPVPNAERSTPHRILGEIMQIFDLHTDNSGAIDGLEGWLEGPKSPFRKPDVVIVTTDRVIRKLYETGVCVSGEADMKQIMTVVSLSREDMHPMRTVAPQMSVSFKNGTYVRDQNRQMLKKVHKTPNHKIHYGHLGNSNAVFVSVDDGSFAKDVARDARFTTMTTFDFMMPTGIALTQHGKVLHGPVRQTTTFCNEMGARYTMSCEAMKTFLHSLFSSGNGVYAYGDMENDEDTAEACMMFYKAPKPGQNEEEFGEGTILIRNEYMRDNYYYNNDLMAMNVISVLQNRTSPVLQPLLVGEGAGEAPTGEADDELSDYFKSGKGKDTDKGGSGPSRKDTDKGVSGGVGGPQNVDDFNKNLVRAIVQSYMTKKRTPVSEGDFNMVYDILYNMTNEAAIEYLRYINMGFGVIWVKPEFVQADSMLFCRPSGFAHFGGSPTQSRKKDLSDESQSILYQSMAYSTTSRQSLGGYPSIMWKNAAMIESQATTTDKVVDVLDDSSIRDALNYLKTTRMAGVENKTFNPSIRGDGWWPLLAPPFMDIEMFSRPSSPVGRFGTQFLSQELHTSKFTDRQVMDCVHPNVFTTNRVFENMWNNINTLMLYNQDLFRTEPDFPFSKYVNFNPIANASLTAIEEAITRSVNTTVNMNRDDTDAVEPVGVDESNLSHMLGAAIPKTCYSDSDLEAEVLVREDLKQANSYRTNTVITNGDTAFFINGQDFVGKWDRCAVSEYSFLN